MSLAERIGGLSPFGPIFGKELRVASRRKRNHLLRVAYLGGLLLFLLMMYTGTANRFSGGQSVASRLQAQAELGQNFFVTFSMFCVICMGLISPILTSTAISAERLGKTLPVLLMTPITSWQIVAGKLLSRLLIAMMLIGLSLPVLALVRLLGGVEAWQMIAVICIAASFALSSAAIGLFFSTLLTRAYGVILISFGAQLVLYGLIPMAIAILCEIFQFNPTGRIWMLLATAHPIFSTFLVTEGQGRMVMLSGGGDELFWVVGVMVQLLLALLLTGASSRILRRIARTAGESAQSAAPPVELPMLEDSSGTSRPPLSGRVVGDNPVLWRELRRPLITGKGRVLAGIIVVLLLVLSYAGFAKIRALDEPELQIGYGFVFNALYMVLAAVLSATVIAQEKEGDTWTVLLASPVSARTVVMGKFLGVMRRMFWPTVLIIAHFALFALVRVIPFRAFLLVVWVIVSFNAIWAATGTYLSLRLRSVTVAVIVNLMIPVVLFIGFPVVLLTLGELIARTDNWAESSLYWIPYFYIGMAIQSLTHNFSGHATISMPSPLHQVTLSFLMRLTIVVGCIHLLAAVGVILHTIGSFDRIVGRARQT